MFSRFTGYALKALAFLAQQPPGKLTGAREIAAATEIPIPFLWKVLRHLNRTKFVRSAKGVYGGYELARPAKQISLISVVEATQRQNPDLHCMLGIVECDPSQPCPLHEPWSDIRDRVQSTLSKKTVADLLPKRKSKLSSKRS
jgi:Rrf2 family protein